MLDQSLKITKDIRSSRWLYDAVVIPKALYVAIAWASHDLTGKEIAILRRINRIGLNMLTYTKKSTPTLKLEIILNTVPLHIQAKKAALNGWARMQNIAIQDWNGWTEHTSRRPLAHRP